MKTPREILLEHHRHAVPKLDQIRRGAIKALDARETSRKTRLSLSGILLALRRLPRTCWQQLILPYRRTWMGVAAAWVFIAVLNFASRDTSPVIAQNSPPPSPEMLAALQNQKLLFAELLLDEAQATDTDRPKPLRPSPHSELILPVVIT